MTGPAVASSNAPHIFVSHSHSDNAYCRVFVAGLRRELGGSNDVVWYDEHNLGWGNIRRTIERELERRQHFIAILSPAAVESPWVNDEIDAALGLLREGQMRTVSFVTAEQCDVPRLLRGYKRIEAEGGAGYPPTEAAARVLRFIWPTAAPPLAVPTERVEKPGKPEPARVTPPQPVSAVARQQQPYTADLELRGILAPAIMRRELFSERVRQLGFTAWTAKDPATGKASTLVLPPMCSVPAGRFLMGSDPEHDRLALNSEMPRYEVRLPAYHIAMFPVTVAEYACFVAAGHAAPRKSPLGTDWRTQLAHPDHPASGVSWFEARDYAAWLANLTGQPWALPGEEEWEKAARWDAAGNDRRSLARTYPWGDRFDPHRCNTVEARIRGTTAVGTYGPMHPERDGSSPCGAQDMAGNVWEWTRTIFDAQAYSVGALPEDDDDPAASRVLRGGSWRAVGKHARSAYRNSGAPGYAGVGVGFRLVLLSAAPGM
ncbi:MAG TPA: SUMF1/EgtB/PvdO family nonheme iron enzyme [Ktedonobacterales bacterium]